MFHRIWGSLIRNDGRWERFPRKYRGTGAPGALAMKGWATILSPSDIWNGKLLPGAVLQAWPNRQIYRSVIHGNRAPIGHSFVFLGYERNGGRIINLRVADNGFHSRTGYIISRTTWGFLIGANIIPSVYHSFRYA